ncbi:MAG: ABC transporter ATP-binding protein [Mariprofundus sp.]|nr:ABC transporter ATP-binding protein [Mariprofundus sp.]
MSALLELEQIAVERGGSAVISDLSCSIHAGEITVVLGPNGAGKSSLLLAMAGLIPVTGRLELNGKILETYARAELSRQVAWQGSLPPTEFGLTVKQRLALAAADPAIDVEITATEMDVAALLSRPLGELSSGERQRVELAALMLRDTPVWLLDEPTAHLDLKHQIHCITMLKQQAEAGRAIVTVLHDIQQAMAIADFVILVDGKCAEGQGGTAYGEAADLLNSATLSELFDAPVVEQGDVLIADYGVTRE